MSDGLDSRTAGLIVMVLKHAASGDGDLAPESRERIEGVIRGTFGSSDELRTAAQFILDGARISGEQVDSALRELRVSLPEGAREQLSEVARKLVEDWPSAVGRALRQSEDQAAGRTDNVPMHGTVPLYHR